MRKNGKHGGSQGHKGKRRDPLKEYAERLQGFLEEQERRARRNRLILAIVGLIAGVLGVLFSHQTAGAISKGNLADGLTQEKLNRLVPWLSCVFMMLCTIPWLSGSKRSAEAPKIFGSRESGHAVHWCKRLCKVVENVCEITEKLALRTALTVLLIIGVVKVLQSEGFFVKRTEKSWGDSIPTNPTNAPPVVGGPESYFYRHGKVGLQAANGAEGTTDGGTIGFSSGFPDGTPGELAAETAALRRKGAK